MPAHNLGLFSVRSVGILRPGNSRGVRTGRRAGHQPVALYPSDPTRKGAEFFGFYNMLGKFATLFGPLLMGWTSMLFGSTRISILSILLLFLGGAYFLAKSTSEGERAAAAFSSDLTGTKSSAVRAYTRATLSSSSTGTRSCVVCAPSAAGPCVSAVIPARAIN